MLMYIFVVFFCLGIYLGNIDRKIKELRDKGEELDKKLSDLTYRLSDDDLK